MKKGILLAVLLFALAVTGSAQIKPAVYAGGGVGLPVSGELGDYWKMGFNFGASFGVQVSPMFEIVGRFNYNPFPLDEEALLSELEALAGMDLTGFEFDGFTMKLTEIGVDVKFLIPAGEEGAPFKPYIVAGGGIVSRSVSDVTMSYMGVSVTVSAEDMGIKTESGGSFNIGFGFEYMFSPTVGLWADGRYVLVNVDPENYGYIPVRAGVKFAFGQ